MLLTLLKHVPCEALLVIRLNGHSLTATVIGSYPGDVIAGGAPWPVIGTFVPGTVETNPDALAALIPAAVRAALPSPPSAALTLELAEPDTMAVLIWCGSAVELSPGDDDRDYRLLAGNVSEVVSLIRDNRFQMVTPAVAKVLGAPAEYWVGRAVRETVPAEEMEAFQDRERRLRAGEAVKERVRAIGADGVPRWIHLHARPFFDASDELDGVIATFRLVEETELRALQNAEDARRDQRRADALYRRSMESAAVGMCLFGPDGRFLEVNDALCRFFGYDAATLSTKTWQELTAEDYLAEDQRRLDEVLAGRTDSYRMAKQYVHADGRLIWGDLTVSCIRDDAGRVENVISHIIDITAAVQAADRLAAELASAADYMSSIMPSGLDGPVRVSSRYLPSRELGGDCFNYTWIDDDRLLVYLIDVSGHGIEPALLAVSLQNMLRSGSIAAQTLSAPAALLAELNRHFQMGRQKDHFFTMWCGVYQASTRTLTYSSAGAPPALAFDYGRRGAPMLTELATMAAPVGMFGDTVFTEQRLRMSPGARLLIYSDGAYEIPMGERGQLTRAALIDLGARLAADPDWSLDDLITELRALSESGLFEDDCSLIQLAFD